MARFGSVCKQRQEDASERQSGGSPGRRPGLGIQVRGQVGDRSPRSRRCSSQSFTAMTQVDLPLLECEQRLVFEWTR